MEKHDKNKQYKVIGGALAAIFVILLLLLLRSCGAGTANPSDGDAETAGLRFAMAEGNLNDATHKTEEEIREELRRKVEEGMMNISMNLSPVFTDGHSEGDLLITNENVNRNAQIVEIYHRGESQSNGDTPIYTSGVIPVGREIAMDRLDQNLEAGTYPCTAYFYSVDEAGSVLGIAAAEVVITVQN